MNERLEWIFPVGQLGWAAVLAALLFHTPAQSMELLRVAGIVAILLACALGVAAVYSMRQSLRVRPSPRSDGQLVAAGVYRWLRHPMYWAVHGITLGLLLLRPSAASIAVALAQYAFYWYKARYEERRLLSHYPDYADYRSRSLGLWP